LRLFRVTELISLLLEARDDKQLLKFRTQLAKLDLAILHLGRSESALK